MSTVARLSAYVAAVALLTAGSYLAGTAVTPPSWLVPPPAGQVHGSVHGGDVAGTAPSGHPPEGAP